jgi:hypothetical protein
MSGKLIQKVLKICSFMTEAYDLFILNEKKEKKRKKETHLSTSLRADSRP